jgi:NitT/TauT family transport system permease protein
MERISMKTNILNIFYRVVPHLLFVAIMILGVMQISSKGSEPMRPFLMFTVILEIVLVLLGRKWEIPAIFDIVFVFILAWFVYSNYLNTRVAFLFPAPDVVVGVFWADILLIIRSIFSSFKLLMLGFVIAIVLGTGLGLVCGNIPRLRNMLLPIAQVLSAIPALVYAPYAIAVLPSFWTAGLFVISIGLFWPIFINTIKMVSNLDKELYDYTRTLKLGKWDLLYHVLLPYCMPGLFNTLTMQISSAFMLLIGAEMMGMTSGVGWYVKYYVDFSVYKKVLAGFITIGILVSIVNAGMTLVKRRALNWVDTKRQNI